jgi:general secretion pathway protein D
VPDGKKIIVGGLLNSSITQNTNKLPFLGDLPLIGKVFQHRYETIENSDLIMEITPRLIDAVEDYKEPKVDKRLSKSLIKFEDENDDE